ncbi:MAG TPA: hypothetical protein VK829_17195 [Terriglobales bacterium]|nr:hypothetical protein [Terriglobales bacterium]
MQLNIKLAFALGPGIEAAESAREATLPERPEFDQPASILDFRVPDIQAAHARLVERNTKIEGEPHIVARMPDHDLWLAEFRDSEGNIMALMSEVRH